MVELKTAELYMPILHLRPSKSYPTKNDVKSRGDCLCFRNSLCLMIKNGNFFAKIQFYLKQRRRIGYYHNDICIFVQQRYCVCLVGQIGFNASETCVRLAIHEALLQCNLSVPYVSPQ